MSSSNRFFACSLNWSISDSCSLSLRCSEAISIFLSKVFDSYHASHAFFTIHRKANAATQHTIFPIVPTSKCIGVTSLLSAKNWFLISEVFSLDESDELEPIAFIGVSIEKFRQ